MMEQFHTRIKKLNQVAGIDLGGKRKLQEEEESSVVVLPNYVPCFSFFTSFTDGDNGWESGFSDYPFGEENWYELLSERTNLPYPLDFNEIGLKQSAKNINSDLFMFIFKKFSGFSPYRTYEIQIKLELATNLDLLTLQDEQSYGNNAFVKMGVLDFQPATHNINLRYETNFDKGTNNTSGADLKIIDNLTNDLLTPQYALKKYTNTENFRLMANQDGELWIVAGIETSINSNIEIYYDKIACLVFCPENQIPTPTPTPTPTGTPNSTPLPSSTPTSTPTSTGFGPTPSVTPPSTSTPTPTDTLAPTPTPSQTSAYTGTAPDIGQYSGEDVLEQINITVSDLAYDQDTIYITPNSYYTASSTFYSMLIYVNSVPRSVVTFTAERTNSTFGYSIFGSVPQVFGTFCGDMCEVYLTI